MFGAITYECMFENELLSFAVVTGQHHRAPWCEVHSPNSATILQGALQEPFVDSLVQTKGEFDGMGVLGDLVAKVKEREDFVNASDRSMVTYRSIVFSAAIRQHPSHNQLSTLYTLRTSARSANRNS